MGESGNEDRKTREKMVALIQGPKISDIDRKLRTALKQYKVLSKKGPSEKLNRLVSNIEGLAQWAANEYGKENNLVKREAMLRLLHKSLIRRSSFNPPMKGSIESAKNNINFLRQRRLSARKR